MGWLDRCKNMLSRHGFSLEPDMAEFEHGEDGFIAARDKLFLLNVRFTIKVSALVCLIGTSTAFLISKSMFVFWMGVGGFVGFLVTIFLLDRANLFARVLYFFIVNIIVVCAVDSGGPTAMSKLYFLSMGCFPILCFSREERVWMIVTSITALVCLNLSVISPGFLFGHRNVPTLVENLLDTNMAFLALMGIIAVSFYRSWRLNQLLLIREREMQRQAKMAAIGHMAGGIAHEINNPLTIVMGNTRRLVRLIEKRLELPVGKELSRDDDLYKTVESIERMSLRIADIVKSMRNVSRPSDSDELLSFSLNDIIGETLALCDEKLKAKNIAFSCFCPEGLKVRCRPGEIVQILLNLFTNSMDAISGQQSPAISVNVQVEGEFALIDVIDSGMGLSAHIVDKLFTPFFTTKPVGEGTGLGLSISYNLALRNNGSLSYTDTAGASTQFRLKLLCDLQ